MSDNRTLCNFTTSGENPVCRLIRKQQCITGCSISTDISNRGICASKSSKAVKSWQIILSHIHINRRFIKMFPFKAGGCEFIIRFLAKMDPSRPPPLFVIMDSSASRLAQGDLWRGRSYGCTIIGGCSYGSSNGGGARTAALLVVPVRQA